jgi:acyl-CoA synthetase (AMP-forming)/AMP-acid ligase II
MTEATSKALTKDGWLKTGDLGMLDKEGFVYIRDRSKLVVPIWRGRLLIVDYCSERYHNSWRGEYRRLFVISECVVPLTTIPGLCISRERSLRR